MPTLRFGDTNPNTFNLAAWRAGFPRGKTAMTTGATNNPFSGHRLTSHYRRFLRSHNGRRRGRALPYPKGYEWNPTTGKLNTNATLLRKDGYYRANVQQKLRTPSYVVVSTERRPTHNSVDHTLELKHAPAFWHAPRFQTPVSYSNHACVEALMHVCAPLLREANRFIFVSQHVVHTNGRAKAFSTETLTRAQLLDKVGSDGNATMSDAELWARYILRKCEAINYGMDTNDNVQGLSVTLHTDAAPTGGSGGALKNEFKKSVFEIVNNDDLCGQRVLAVHMRRRSVYNKAINEDNKTEEQAKERVKTEEKKLQKKGGQTKKKPNLQKALAEDIAKRIGVKGRMALTDFETAARVLKARVFVFSARDTLVYSSDDYRTDKTDTSLHIYVFWDAFHASSSDEELGHYHLIKRVDSFHNGGKKGGTGYKWCTECKKFISCKQFLSHKCVGNRCPRCNRQHSNCFANQVESEAFVCEVCNIPCPTAECLHEHKAAHHVLKHASGGKKAGELGKARMWRCDKCKTFVDKQRFDAGEHRCGETQCGNCREYHHKNEVHKCNIMKSAITAKTCGENRSYVAWDLEAMFTPEKKHVVNFACTRELYTGKRRDFDTLDELVTWMLQQKNVTFIAHNGKAYDNWLLHEHLKTKGMRKPTTLTMSGQKIMYMQFVNGLRFIDSLNFVPFALSKLPDIFGLDADVSKQYFPYIFNTVHNQDYVGPFPPREAFEPETMKPSDAALAEYGCHQKATRATQREFDEWYDAHADETWNHRERLRAYCRSDVDILALAMEKYRDSAKEMHDGLDPLAGVTSAGYAMKCYLSKYAPTEPDVEGRTPNAVEAKQTALAVLEKEHAAFIRRAFRGGRTEVFRQYVKMTRDDLEAGRYITAMDIKSLYPAVQYYDELPYGHPTMHVYNANEQDRAREDALSLFGFVQCDITCPTDLRVPVLGGFSPEGKFQFDLHDKKDVVVCTPELVKAVALGYTITRVYAIAAFKKTRGLFKDYVRTGFKCKEEAGFNGDEEEKARVIAQSKATLGIHLDPDQMKKNPGKKQCAKLHLNSLWGRFSMRHFPTTEYVTKPEKYLQLFRKHCAGKITIHGREHTGNDVLVKYSTPSTNNLRKTNVAVCAMITAQARLRLYEVIGHPDMADRLVLCDTDSCYYVHDPERWDPMEAFGGDGLGEWELDHSDKVKIVRIAAPLPKMYAYETVKKEQHTWWDVDFGDEDARAHNAFACESVKGKGVRLTHQNLLNANLDSYTAMVQHGTSIATVDMDFRKSDGEIHTKSLPKTLTLDLQTFKRRVLPDFSTVPHGYVG